MTSRREIQLSGENLWLCGMTGQVAGDKKWSENRMRTSVASTGHVVVNSQVNTRHEFWLVAPDGEERLVEFFNSTVAVREGQWMTAIWGARQKQEKGPFLMLRNNNAQNSSWLISNPRTLLNQMGLQDPLGKFVLMGIGVAFVFWILFHGWLISFLALIAGVVVGNERRKAKAANVQKAVSEAMTLEVQSFSSGPYAHVAAASPRTLAP